MSEHTILTAPKVSTAGSLRTIVFTLTILVTPSANTIVTTAVRPSGTAATASAIAVINISTISLPCKTAIPNIATTITTATIPRTLPRSLSLLWRGVNSSVLSFIIAAILPISVSIPV